MKNFSTTKQAFFPFVICVLTALLALNACVDKGQILPNRNYNMVWSDEFDGALGQAIDTSKWVFDIGRGQNGWGNQELQYYTNSTNNVALDGNGNLQIIARAESFQGASYTSGRITTKNKHAVTYGKIEARIQLPYSQGLWPAFWMLGSNIDEVSWPNCGEIDIMEYRGQQPTKALGSVHGPGYSAGNSISESYYLNNDRFDTGFHTFAIEWGQDYIDFFIDGFRYNTITPQDVTGEWVFNQDFFMLLNVAVGGSFVGPPNAQSVFPQTMLVDYVRVYEQL